jgi:DNA-binding MarR family transcriptional regulator
MDGIPSQHGSESPEAETTALIRRVVMAYLHRTVAWRLEQCLSLHEDVVLTYLGSQPATSADLCRRIGITSASMTHIVAGLERRGLIRRLPHPTDGRSILLYSTKSSISMRAQDGVAHDIESAMAGCSPEQHAAVTEFLRRAAEQLDAAAASTP